MDNDYRERLKAEANWPQAGRDITDEMLLCAIENAKRREEALRAMGEKYAA